MKKMVLGISVTLMSAVIWAKPPAFQSVDTNKDGALSVSEYVTSQQLKQQRNNKPGYSVKIITRWFEKYDVDKDGMLSSKEYYEGLDLSKKEKALKTPVKATVAEKTTNVG